jgi:hypothetical protein
MANKEARTAMRDEQLLKKGGVDIQLANAQLKKLEQDMLGLEEQLGIAMSQGKEDRANDLRRAINEKKLEAQAKQAEIDYKNKAGNAAIMNAEANRNRTASEKISGNLEVTYPNLPGSPPIRARIGAPLANGNIVGQGTGKQYTQDEWANGGMIVEENAVKARLGIGQQTTPNTPNTPAKKKPAEGVVIEQFFNGTGLGQ